MLQEKISFIKRSSRCFNTGVVGCRVAGALGAFTADMSISDNFAIGADFKYMTNVTSRQDTRYQQSIVNPSSGFGSAVEDLQYYTISLAGKFLF